MAARHARASKPLLRVYLQRNTQSNQDFMPHLSTDAPVRTDTSDKQMLRLCAENASPLRCWEMPAQSLACVMEYICVLTYTSHADTPPGWPDVRSAACNLATAAGSVQLPSTHIRSATWAVRVADASKICRKRGNRSPCSTSCSQHSRTSQQSFCVPMPLLCKDLKQTSRLCNMQCCL